MDEQSLDKNNENKKSNISSSQEASSYYNEIASTFEQINLREELLRGMYAYGYEKPLAVQQKSLIPCTKGKDVILQAPQGTGKTLTCLISILQQVDLSIKECQAVIVTPTRELAQNIRHVILYLAQYMEISCEHCTTNKEMTDKLQKGFQILVGTPGRLLKLIDRNDLDMKLIKMMFFDEIDELLSRGFKEQIHDILCKMPHKAQIIITTATKIVYLDLSDIEKKFMKDPLYINVNCQEKTLEGIKQYYVDFMKEEWKLEVLYELYSALNPIQTVIYCNEINTAVWLNEKLQEKDMKSTAIHGDMDMKEQELKIREFRTGSSRILIKTDLSREVDVAQISFVLNYDLPNDHEIYIERIGRSGKFGRSGLVINLVKTEEKSNLFDIERLCNTKISELPSDVSDLI